MNNDTNFEDFKEGLRLFIKSIDNHQVSTTNFQDIENKFQNFIINKYFNEALSEILFKNNFDNNTLYIILNLRLPNDEYYNIALSKIASIKDISLLKLSIDKIDEKLINYEAAYINAMENECLTIEVAVKALHKVNYKIPEEESVKLRRIMLSTIEKSNNRIFSLFFKGQLQNSTSRNKVS